MFRLQKSRNLCFKEGDKNTKFFDVSIIVRNRRNKIEGLNDDYGNWAIGTLIKKFRGLFLLTLSSFLLLLPDFRSVLNQIRNDQCRLLRSLGEKLQVMAEVFRPFKIKESVQEGRHKELHLDSL